MPPVFFIFSLNIRPSSDVVTNISSTGIFMLKLFTNFRISSRFFTVVTKISNLTFYNRKYYPFLKRQCNKIKFFLKRFLYEKKNFHDHCMVTLQMLFNVEPYILEFSIVLLSVSQKYVF